MFRHDQGEQLGTSDPDPEPRSPTKHQEPVEPWITTFTGRQFFVRTATEDDIDVRDIAHALSNICRFAGHCRTFYSVAEHCLRLAELCRPGDELEALMHDSPEAYLLDMPSLVKRVLPKYMAIDKHLMHVIVSKYHLSLDALARVKRVEYNFLAAEVTDLMNVKHLGWNYGETPLDKTEHIIPWSPQIAEDAFLRLFKELTDGRYSH